MKSCVVCRRRPIIPRLSGKLVIAGARVAGLRSRTISNRLKDLIVAKCISFLTGFDRGCGSLAVPLDQKGPKIDLPNGFVERIERRLKVVREFVVEIIF